MIKTTIKKKVTKKAKTTAKTKIVLGRPRKLDDKQVLLMRKKGMTMAAIATQLDVTDSAIAQSLQRSVKQR
jgi:predicted transcriptional regulator